MCGFSDLIMFSLRIVISGCLVVDGGAWWLVTGLVIGHLVCVLCHLAWPSLPWLQVLLCLEARLVREGIRPWPWNMVLYVHLFYLMCEHHVWCLAEEQQRLGHLVGGLQQGVPHLLHLDDAAETRGHLNTNNLLSIHISVLSPPLYLLMHFLCAINALRFYSSNH